MKITEIAERAGVSIATVSHVLNKTRYVSPELTQRVLSVIGEVQAKPGHALRNIKAAKARVILCFTDYTEAHFNTRLVEGIRRKAGPYGYQVTVIHSANHGLIQEYVRLEKPSGLMMITDDPHFKFKEWNLPTIVIRCAEGEELPENHIYICKKERAYKAAGHMVKSGHDRVCFLYCRKCGRSPQTMIDGYMAALRENGIPCDPAMVIGVDDSRSYDKSLMPIIFDHPNSPTALICADDEVTFKLLKFLKIRNVKCPDDVSLICLNDFELSEIVEPAVTTVAHDPAEIGETALEKLHRKIENPHERLPSTTVPSRFSIRNSTQSIGRGPFGEKAESPELLHLDPAEAERVKAGSYTAAISFHYSGTAWARLHEKGIKDVFSELGVKVLVVTDAHFDPEIQNKQHMSIQALKPDVLISIPADDILTASTYRKMVESGTKLVLINNIPHGFQHGDYVTCVTVNEKENGQIAGRILGEYLTAHGKRKIGLLQHGAPFFSTRQRDEAVEQVLHEEFPELEIVARGQFRSEKNAFAASYEMIKAHPEIEGLYVTWEGPALAVLHALCELRREDIGIVTADLDREVALNLASGGPIKGLSAQRPYEQGRAMAMAAALTLLGKRVPPYIGVTPYKVTAENLLAGWQDVLKERPPLQLVHTLKSYQAH